MTRSNRAIKSSKSGLVIGLPDGLGQSQHFILIHELMILTNAKSRPVSERQIRAGDDFFLVLFGKALRVEFFGLGKISRVRLEAVGGDEDLGPFLDDYVRVW